MRYCRKVALAMAPALLLALVLLGWGCTPDQIRRVRELNADLALGLNRATITIVGFNEQGIVSLSEQENALTHIYSATLLSDSITVCTDAVNAKDTLQGCVRPLLIALRDEINPELFHLNSPTAQTSVRAILSGAIVVVNEIAEVRQ